jgi:hypothetical protein
MVEGHEVVGHIHHPAEHQQPGEHMLSQVHCGGAVVRDVGRTDAEIEVLQGEGGGGGHDEVVVYKVGRIEADLEEDVLHGGAGGGSGEQVVEVTCEVGTIEAEAGDIGTHWPHSQQYPGGQSASQVH